jgi:hypothetical protein
VACDRRDPLGDGSGEFGMAAVWGWGVGIADGQKYFGDVAGNVGFVVVGVLVKVDDDLRRGQHPEQALVLAGRN